MFTSKLPALISVASLSLILCACGGGKSEEGSTLDQYDDSQSVLDAYDDSQSVLDAYDNSQSVLDGYDGDQSVLDAYDDSQSVLDLYDDSTSVLDSYLDGEPGNDRGGSGSTGGNNSGGGGSGGGNAPAISYLDCTNLNPNKVYLLGALRWGLGVNYALIDPEDPSRIFCVGFEDPSSALISTNGLIYDYAGINLFVQDELEYSTSWGYPSFPQSDDIELSDEPVDRIYLRDNSTVYYVDFDQNLFSIDQPEIPYYEFPNRELQIITPDGGLLISNLAGYELDYVDPELNRTQLQLPIEGEFTFMSARMHGSDDVWLHVIDSNDNDRRWNFNISTQTLTDEGVFSGLPENTRVATNGSKSHRDVAKMNSDGQLIQMALDDSQEDFYKYVILKRFVESAETSTQILLRDSDYTGNFHWDEDEMPYVHIQVGMLITGF